MKFTIDREAFTDVLFAATTVVKKASTMPILACCLIEASEDGHITVHGTNLDVWVRRTVAADVTKAGRCVVDLSRLFRTVKSSPAGPVEVALDASLRLGLNQARVSARLAGHAPEEFPEAPKVGELAHRIRVATILDLIEKTLFCASRDETRAALCGGYLHNVDGGLRMVATDGHRAAKLTLAQGEGEDFRGFDYAIIPREGLEALRRVLAGDGSATFGVDGDDLHVRADDLVVSIRLVPSRFPDYRPGFAQVPTFDATINRHCLVDSLKRAALYTTATNMVALEFGEGSLAISARDDSGSIEESIPCQCEATGELIHFNYRYLRDVLAVIEGDDVVLGVQDKNSPTYVRDSARDDVVYIVMPMDGAKQ